MSRSGKRWWMVGGLGVLLSALVVGQALAAISFSGVPSGTGRIANYTWDNGDPAIAATSTGTVHAVYDSDYIDPTCNDKVTGYQLHPYYSKLTSNGWTKPLQLTPKLGERATLATNGTNLYVAYMTQTRYYASDCRTINFNTNAARYVYVRRNTTNGTKAGWGAAVKLPGQTTSSRGDYLYIAASGTNVYVTTTNTSTGDIWLWVSTDSGATFNDPVSVGTTTFQDSEAGNVNGACPCGYVGGFSGLPAMAANTHGVVVAYTANPSGKVNAAVCNTSGGACATTQLTASGGADNFGFASAAADSTRLGVAWTTAAGGFVRIYSSGAWKTAHQFVTFPDSSGVGSTYNKGGEGPILALDPGTSTLGISLSECATVNGITCAPPDGTLEKAREQLVWRQSTDNGSTWSTPYVIQAPSTAKTTYVSDYGSATYVNGDPYVLFNGHDDFYGYYDVEVRNCGGC